MAEYGPNYLLPQPAESKTARRKRLRVDTAARIYTETRGCCRETSRKNGKETRQGARGNSRKAQRPQGTDETMCGIV